MTIDVMIDLETLGKGLKPAVIQIAAVPFSQTDDLTHIAPFDCYISKQANLDAGLDVEPETVSWWESQGDEAKKVLAAADASELSVLGAIEELRAYLHNLRQESSDGVIRIWGNGSVFDNRILMAACTILNVPMLWKYNEDRDLRTLIQIGNMFRMDLKSIPFEGTKHNGIDDAKHQVKQALAVLNKLQTNLAVVNFFERL